MHLSDNDQAWLRRQAERLIAAEKGLAAAEADWQVAKAAFLRRHPAPDPADPVATVAWLKIRNERIDLAYWWGMVADYHHELAAVGAAITGFVEAHEALGYSIPPEVRAAAQVPRQVPRAA